LTKGIPLSSNIAREIRRITTSLLYVTYFLLFKSNEMKFNSHSDSSREPPLTPTGRTPTRKTLSTLNK